RPDGQKQRLTKRVHSQLSGGEQSVALHLPLFAAANAVFGSAASHTPRMVGLDEAFAGVDEKGRGELMSLAAEFDLQMIMTGYDLWATFPDIAGAAHYSLSHDETTAAVSAMLMVWNGAANTEAHDYDGSLAAALGSPGTGMVPDGVCARPRMASAVESGRRGHGTRVPQLFDQGTRHGRTASDHRHHRQAPTRRAAGA